MRTPFERGERLAGTIRAVMMPLVLVTVVLSQSGCLIFGRRQVESRMDPAAVAEIKVGMEKSQVTDILGAPQDILFSNKDHDPLREHAYIYEHETSHYTGISLAFVNFGNATTNKDRVVVFFDDGGKVIGVGDSLDARRSGFGFPFGK